MINSGPYDITSGKETLYAFNRRLGGPQRWTGRFGEQTNLLPLPALEPNLVTLLTTLSFNDDSNMYFCIVMITD